MVKWFVDGNENMVNPLVIAIEKCVMVHLSIVTIDIRNGKVSRN